MTRPCTQHEGVTDTTKPFHTAVAVGAFVRYEKKSQDRIRADLLQNDYNMMSSFILSLSLTIFS